MTLFQRSLRYLFCDRSPLPTYKWPTAAQIVSVLCVQTNRTGSMIADVSRSTLSVGGWSSNHTCTEDEPEYRGLSKNSTALPEKARVKKLTAELARVCSGPGELQAQVSRVIDNKAYTLLHVACRSGNTSCARALLRLGASQKAAHTKGIC